MKEETDKKISYTHCEYKVALAGSKPHQTYLVGKDWEIVRKLKEKDWNQTDCWREVRDPLFDGVSNENIKHYFNVRNKACEFKEEAEREFCPRISDIGRINSDLAENIPRWYSEGKISLKDFCGRRDDIRDLLEKMGDSVEVYGVGGVGKTTLIQVALLIQKLRGKRIVIIGTRQSYSTGSGYNPFKYKSTNEIYKIVGDRISLDDIAEALSISQDMITESKDDKINRILDEIENEQIYLFIDDFHLADEDVEELVKRMDVGLVLASKKLSGVARKELFLSGIDEDDRDKLIDLAAKDHPKRISEEAREKIKIIAEGHPVSTKILVRNYDKIDFRRLERYDLDFLNPKHSEESMKRLVTEILSDEAFGLLRCMSVINTDLESNICLSSIKETYPDRFDELFSELVDTGMLVKREGLEGTYQFSYKHIQEFITSDEGELHEKAAKYYENKIKLLGKTLDDDIELLFHRARSNPDSDIVQVFLRLRQYVTPIHDGFKRLIYVGEVLRGVFRSEREDLAQISGTLANLYSDLKRFDEAEAAYKEALVICKELAEMKPDAYLPGLLQTQANIGMFYNDTDRTEEGMKYLLMCLERRDLLPDFGAVCFIALGAAYEKLQNSEDAALNYIFASATRFLLFKKGIPCRDEVLFYLEKSIELGDEEIKGDAEMMRTAIVRLAGEEVEMPEVTTLSERGEALREALNGRTVELNPRDEVDLMALILIKELSSLNS